MNRRERDRWLIAQALKPDIRPPRASPLAGWVPFLLGVALLILALSEL